MQNPSTMRSVEAALDLRAFFSRFRSAQRGRLHFTAHSHHFWPDVTRDAQLKAWDDAARLVDDKWELVLGPIWSEVSANIAQHLSLPGPRTLVYAPNTHQFIMRLLSACPIGRPVRVLSTDGEFHSFRRQMARLTEDRVVEWIAVPAEPFDTLTERLIHAGSKNNFDLVFVSQVLFESGFALVDLRELVDGLSLDDRLIVIDGYHGFLARPTDLSRVWKRAFYIAGGYKYAMAGEGVCFMHCPPGLAPRPRDTGWFAGFDTLAARQTTVDYSEDARRFMGATFDPSGLYRLRASLRWLSEQKLDAGAIHAHAVALQVRFVSSLEQMSVGPFAPERLLIPITVSTRGNFLVFEHSDAGVWSRRLYNAGIVVDSRGTRLRIGFGLQHAPADVDALLARLYSLRGG